MNKQFFAYAIIYIMAYLSMVFLGDMHIVSMNMTLLGIAVLSVLLMSIMCSFQNLYVIFVICSVAFIQGVSVKFNYPWIVYISLGSLLVITVGICILCYIKKNSSLYIQKQSLVVKEK